MSLEFNTRVDYKYQGGDTVFSVPFSYINKSHIIVVVNGDAENPVTDFTWLSENQIRIDSEINTGDIVSVRRITPIDDKMVVFEDNNILDEETQNLAQDQVFNVVQEIKDASDNLNADMEEFVDLKNTIDSQLESISEAGELVQEAYATLEDTHNLVQGISETYEEMKTQVDIGLPVNVMQNLFTLTITDKTLNEDESLGLAEQGSTQTEESYPDAYQTLVDEFIAGETKVYQSSDVESYAQFLNGEITGDFYIPSDVELAQGSTIYSDIDCVTSIGTLEEVNKTIANEYEGSITNLFYTKNGEDLQIGTEVYTDKTLNTSLGVVEDIQELQIDKYNLAKTGDVYKPVDTLLSEGTVLYKDITCTEEAGTITHLAQIKVVKYYLSHAEYKCFYVPEDTIIKEGTQLYADAALTIPLGKIKSKGVQRGENYYYYRISKMNLATWNGGIKGYVSVTNNYYFMYTKEKLKSYSAIPYYYDKACTLSLGKFYINSTNDVSFFNNDGVRVARTYDADWDIRVPYSINKIMEGEIQYDYITLEDDEVEGKYEYYKQAVTTSGVIGLNNNPELEGYKGEGVVEDIFLKITDTPYQTFEQTDELTTVSIKVNIENVVGNTEIVTSKGIVTSTGIVFEYREHPNGHKIVDGKYKNVYSSLNPNEFYLLNTEDKTFTVPILDDTKHIYFCVGNIKIYNAEIGTITHNEFYKELARCIKHEDVELLDEMSAVIENYDNNLQQIQQALGIVEELTEDIIEEL